MAFAMAMEGELLSPTCEVKFYSEWSDPTGELVSPDSGRHEAFVTYARLVVAVLRPHLLPFLDGARARVLVGRGIFCFDLPAARDTWIEVEDVASRLQLLPWVDPDEVSH